MVALIQGSVIINCISRCIEECDVVQAGQTVEFEIYSNPWTLAKSDFFGNYYISDPNFDTVFIDNTKISPIFVKDFTSDETLLNKPASQWKPWSLQERFDRFKLTDYSELDGEIGKSKNDDAMMIRSLMIDISRNFHSLDTLKVRTRL